MDITGQPVEAPAQPVTEALAPEAAPKEDALAPKFAALAKKEKWARKLAEDAKRQMDEVKKKQEDYEKNYVPKSKIKDDFLNVALEAGLTPDQIANILLSQAPQGQIDPNVQSMRELKQEIQALKDELTQTKTGWQDKEKTQYEQGVQQVRTDVTRLVSQNPDYETIKATDNIEKVVEYIKTTYEEDGVLMSIEEAAKEVEEALVEDALMKFSKSKRLQEKLKALMPKEEPKQSQQVPQQSQHRTLTNAMSPSSKSSMTSKDRRQRAILRAQGYDPDAVINS